MVVFERFFAELFKVASIVFFHHKFKIPPKPADTHMKPAKHPHRPAKHLETHLPHTAIPVIYISTSVDNDLGIGLVG